MVNGISYNIPVITYHSVDESGSVISVRPDIFENQMRFLFESGVRSCYYSDLIDAIGGKKTLGKNSVVLTFDDGFENFLTTAFPILEKYKQKATVFVVSGYCGSKNEWAGNTHELSPSRLLSWSQIKELHGLGVEFGAHSHSHPDLTGLTPSEVQTEMSNSKSMIEDATGTGVRAFAYPYGRLNKTVKELAKNHFDSACSTVLAKVTPRSDVYSLERVDSYYLSNPKLFESLSSGLVGSYLSLRRILRAVKANVYSAY